MMKKKFLYSAAIAIIFFMLGLISVLCWEKMAVNSSPETEEKAANYSKAEIALLTLENNIVLDGKFCSDVREMIDEIQIPDNSIIEVEKGDTVCSGGLLARDAIDGSKTYLSQINGRVLDIISVSNGDNAIKILNSNKMEISLLVNYDLYKEITYSSTFYLWEYNQKKNECVIDDIGYIAMSNGQFEIKLHVLGNMNYLPGMDVSVLYRTVENEPQLVIPADFVFDKGNFYTVIVCDSFTGEYQEVKIGIGEKITVIENGRTFYYYEVTEGFSNGDIVYRRFS